MQLHILFALFATGHGLKCLNENGKEVDWFILYKAPKLDVRLQPKFKEGQAYYYMDDNKKHWSLSNLTIDDNDSALAKTLNPIYTQTKVQYYMYNDHFPNNKKVTYNGHTKGILAINNPPESGFWIIHSIPQFPPVVDQNQGDGNYSFPKSGLTNGQIIMCISIDKVAHEIINNILAHGKPHIYSYWPTNRRFIKISSKVIEVKEFLSSENIRFQIISKPSISKEEPQRKDIYQHIAEILAQDILVQSWIKDHEKFPPMKGVRDIKIIELHRLCQHETTKDHSKWAITTNRKVEPGIQELKNKTGNIHLNITALQKCPPEGKKKTKVEPSIEELRNKMANINLNNPIFHQCPPKEEKITKELKRTDCLGATAYPTCVDESSGQTEETNIKLKHQRRAQGATSSEQEESAYWICIGSINREDPPSLRSGPTVCFQDNDVWKAFKDLIVEIF